MKISIKGYITSKESELFSDCADRYAINKTHHKFAISDGVSKSFFPKYWAEILVENFVKSKEINDNTFIQECQGQWFTKVTDIVKKPNVKWFTTNAYNSKRPGLATFVGLQFFQKEEYIGWKANAIGDSFLFFVPKQITDFENDCIKLSSKTDLIFDNFPDYLSSIGETHKGEKRTKEEQLEEGTFYLMTDALAEWFINEKENALEKINVWESQKDFERFVNEERISTKLGNDDSAILIIKVDDDKKNKISYSEINVSNISDLALEQEKEIEKTKKIELERKKKIEEAEKLKEEKTKEEQEKAAIEKKEEEEKEIEKVKETSEKISPEIKERTETLEVEAKNEFESGKSDEPNKNKKETLNTESQPVVQKDEPKKTFLEKSIEGVKKGVEKIGEVLTGKTEDSTEEKNEHIPESVDNPVIQKTDSENKVKTTEEETTNPKQEITPKEANNVQKKANKGSTPSKSNITDKF